MEDGELKQSWKLIITEIKKSRKIYGRGETKKRGKEGGNVGQAAVGINGRDSCQGMKNR